MGLNINVLQVWVVTSNWLIKPTDTGTVLNYRSYALTQNERSVILGTVHRIFRSSSNWEQFDKTTETNRAQWLKNRCPEKWSASLAVDALLKIIDGKESPSIVRGVLQLNLQRTRSPMLMVQYRGKSSQYFANKL